MKQKKFWDKEYKNPAHLAISDEPADDLEKFTRWLSRQKEELLPPQDSFVVDLGCGNGRNLIYLSRELFVKGLGIDTSKEAITQAKNKAGDLPIEFKVGSVKDPIDLPSESVDLVLDMMVSHYLKKNERENLLKEILRILKPGGWLFIKTFLKDADIHAMRLIKENPGDEPDSYIHPKIGTQEYVYTERKFTDFFEPYFDVGKIEKSHKHLKGGRAWKRRTITGYFRKKEDL